WHRHGRAVQRAEFDHALRVRWKRRRGRLRPQPSAQGQCVLHLRLRRVAPVPHRRTARTRAAVGNVQRLRQPQQRGPAVLDATVRLQRLPARGRRRSATGAVVGEDRVLARFVWPLVKEPKGSSFFGLPFLLRRAGGFGPAPTRSVCSLCDFALTCEPKRKIRFKRCCSIGTARCLIPTTRTRLHIWQRSKRWAFHSRLLIWSDTTHRTGTRYIGRRNYLAHDGWMRMRLGGRSMRITNRN